MAENDPLLPRNRPAPEITGYGYSKPSKSQDNGYQDHTFVEVEDESSYETLTPSATPRSSLRIIIAMFTIVVGLALFISAFIPGGLTSPWDSSKNDSVNIAERVDKILSKNPLIDGHNDLAILIRYLYHNKIYDDEFTRPFEDGGLRFHVDLPRLKSGKVGGAFWSAYVGCPEIVDDFTDGNYAEVVSTTLSQLDVLRRLTTSYTSVFSSIHINSSNAIAAFEEHQQLISPLAIEGLHQIGNAYSNLRLYYSLGVRYATLTHNCHNKFADAALITNCSGTTIKAPPLWGGLSDRGVLAIKEMNRIGMLVDIAHVSKETMVDVLGGRPDKTDGSAAPVIFSHSSAYALCPHPRNVPDDVLELVKKTNSIVMVNFSPDFISCVPSKSSTGLPDLYPPNATLHQVARHITYIGDKIGYDHVGIGSDFDGIFDTPKGLEDVSKFPDLIAELLKMGLSDEDAAKVVGRNVLRVWADADKVAQKMQKDGVLPVEDFVQGIPITELL